MVLTYESIDQRNRDLIDGYSVCRIGDKYGPEYEEYLERKLSKYNIIWIREIHMMTG